VGFWGAHFKGWLGEGGEAIDALHLPEKVCFNGQSWLLNAERWPGLLATATRLAAQKPGAWRTGELGAFALLYLSFKL